METAQTQVQASASLSSAYLSFTDTEQAEFTDGVWEWSFNFQAEGQSLTIRTTAEELSNGVEWNMYISGDFEDENVDEFRYMTGFTADDQSSGNWQYFSPDFPDRPVVEYQWTSESDDQTTFSTIFYEPENDEESRIDYIKDGVDNTLDYTGFDTDTDVQIYWNSSDGTGYIDRAGEDRQCWDDSFAEVSCS